jgi:hypothetical protein
MAFRIDPSIPLICLLFSFTAGAASARLPEGWPADAPPPPDARIVTSDIQQLTQSIAFEVPAPENEALADISQQLERNGWASESAGRTGRQQSARFSKLDGRTMTVLVQPTLEGSTAVLFTIYQPA